MGSSEYTKMLWRKKQSETMRYILRMRTWHYRQLKAVHRVPHPSRPDKARMLGYKAKQGYVIYRSRIRRGAFKRHCKKGQTMGKPKNEGVYELKLIKNDQVRCESSRMCKDSCTFEYLQNIKLVHSMKNLTKWVA